MPNLIVIYLLSRVLVSVPTNSVVEAQLAATNAPPAAATSFDAFRIIVGDTLAPAHRFYQRMGATMAGEVQVHEGEGSKVYVHRMGAPF